MSASYESRFFFYNKAKAVVDLKIFDELQSISKALLLPVSVLPAAAILFRFGSDDLLNIDVLEKAGGTIFENLPVIFAISIAFGLTRVCW